MLSMLKKFWKDSSPQDKFIVAIIFAFGFPLVSIALVGLWYMFFSMIGSFL